MSTASKIPERLRMERQRLGLTQIAIAGRLGIPVVTYRTYESGRSEPPLRLMNRLADVGIDAIYVALNHPTSEFAIASINWELLTDISLELCAWSASRPRPLDTDELERFLRVVYAWGVQHGREEGFQLLATMCRAA